jgi:hypothetical protein
MPLVIKSDLHVDLQSTASMFGRSGVVRPKTFQSVIGPPPFHPIGHFITLFNYRRLTYIAALFDAGGDFAGRRKGDAGLANVLGVFLRRHQTTKELCEYRLSGKDYPPASASASGVIGAE